MKHPFIFLLSFLLLGNATQAQFNKPLSTRNQFYSNQAKYNIGLIGGATSTYWLHFGGTKTPYKQSFNIGITGGLVVERMLNKDMSIGVEALYAMRNTQLHYEVLNFPVSLGAGPEHNKDYYRQYTVEYHEINIQTPFTYYLGQGNMRPFLFGAARVSVPLFGSMNWQKKEILNYGTANQTYSEEDAVDETVELNAQNTRQFNVGVVVGGGVLFRINVSNYYLLLKADASYHVAVINSFTQEEKHGESQNVVGAGYIDPYLLGKRFNTDANVRFTLLFPLKKQLKGACMRWGEYD